MTSGVAHKRGLDHKQRNVLPIQCEPNGGTFNVAHADDRSYFKRAGARRYEHACLVGCRCVCRSDGQSVDAKNQAPLPPAGPAGIKQAQGFFGDNRLLTLALVGAVLVTIWILLEDDDDEVPATTGT